MNKEMESLSKTISIVDIISSSSQIKIATTQDNLRIINFLKTVSMKTDGMELYYDRSPNFFTFLKEQGEKEITFLFENKDQSLQGMAIITFRKAYVEKEIVTVGYLSDLRINELLDRRVRVQWRKMYSQILIHCEDIKEFNHCKYYYSAILGGNNAAIKSLTSNRGSIHYHLLSKYKAITILGRIIKIKLSSHYVLKTGNEIDQSKLIQFLDIQEQSLQFGHVFGQSNNYEWERRKRDWKNFNISKFLLICNQNDEIVSATLPWSDIDSRKLVVKKASLVNRVLGLTKLLLGTKPLYQGKSLQFLYLTHLNFKANLDEFEKCEILKFYLNYLFKKNILKSFHGISYIDFSGYSNLLSKRNYLKHTTDGLFFQVKDKNKMSLPTRQCSFEIATS